MAAFLSEIYESGRFRTAVNGLSGEQLSMLPGALREIDSLARLELPGEAPTFDEASALWAAVTLHHAARSLVHRSIAADEARRVLSVRCPSGPSPSVCYSVDLALRFLPDLVILSRGIAPADPLVEGLLRIAAAWPLSSVGVKGLGEVDPSPFLDDPCLRLLYVDRILERKDFARARHPVVREAVRLALGHHLALAPGALAEEDRP